jgi:hypothetical protein
MNFYDLPDFAQGNLQGPDVNQAYHPMTLKSRTNQGSSRTQIPGMNDIF